MITTYLIWFTIWIGSNPGLDGIYPDDLLEFREFPKVQYMERKDYPPFHANRIRNRIHTEKSLTHQNERILEHFDEYTGDFSPNEWYRQRHDPDRLTEKRNHLLDRSMYIVDDPNVRLNQHIDALTRNLNEVIQVFSSE